MAVGPDRTVGSIQIRERIGQELGCEVYLGHQPGLDRRVLLRKLRRDQFEDRALVEAFRAGARMAARVSHPNVQAVYDLFAVRGDHYVVLEHLDGPRLDDALAQYGPPDTGVVAAIGTAIARGLQALHDRGVVHAALSPGLVRTSCWGDVQIGGLDYARPTTGRAQTPPMSPWNAPEIAAGRDATRASDIWALGAILLWLATGRAPDSEPPKLEGVDRLLARWIRRCLAPSPAGRPGASELERVLARRSGERSDLDRRAAIASWLTTRDMTRAPATEPETPAPSPAAAVKTAAPAATPAEPDGGAPAAVEAAAAEPLFARTRLAAAGAAALAAGLALLIWLPLRNGTEPTPADPELLALAGLEPPSVDAGAGPGGASAEPGIEPASLRVIAHPWAEIRIDDGPPLWTPQARPLRLAPGRHQIELRHPRFGSTRRELELGPGQRFTLRHLWRSEVSR